ncbi:unnamed protein product [Arctogadus glacialis]
MLAAKHIASHLFFSKSLPPLTFDIVMNPSGSGVSKLRSCLDLRVLLGSGCRGTEARLAAADHGLQVGIGPVARHAPVRVDLLEGSRLGPWPLASDPYLK